MLKERLKIWLVKTGTTREELAAKLNLSRRTVEGWLQKSNPRPLPLRLRPAIEELIAPTAEPGCIPVELTFTDEQWERLTAHIPDGPNKKEQLVKQIMAMLEAMQLPK